MLTSIIESKLIFSGKRHLSNTLLGLLIVLPTGYAFLNAHYENTTGDRIFPLLLFVVLTRYLIKDNNKISHSLLVFFWIYFFIAQLSLVFPASEYANFVGSEHVFYRLICASLIILLFNIFPNEKIFLQYTLAILTASIATLALLLSFDIFDKNSLNTLTPLAIAEDAWNDKFISSWLLFLTWGSIYLLWDRSFKRKCVALTIMVLSFTAIFYSTSEGAKLATVISTIVFFSLHLIKLNKNYYVYLFVSLGYLLIPVALCFYFISVPFNHNKYEHSLLRKIIDKRIYIYHHSYKLISEKPLMGYGFRSAAKVHFPDAEKYSKYWKEKTFPGRHPHSLPFFFLIEHGIIGALFILGATYYFYYSLYQKSQKDKAAFIGIPLLVSFQVIYSFSYSIWHADIVLLVLFFFMISRIILSSFTDNVIVSTPLST